MSNNLRSSRYLSAATASPVNVPASVPVSIPNTVDISLKKRYSENNDSSAFIKTLSRRKDKLPLQKGGGPPIYRIFQEVIVKDKVAVVLGINPDGTYNLMYKAPNSGAEIRVKESLILPVALSGDSVRRAGVAGVLGVRTPSPSGRAPSPPVYGSQPGRAPSPPVYGSQPNRAPSPPVYASQPNRAPSPPVYGSQPNRAPSPPVYASQPNRALPVQSMSGINLQPRVTKTNGTSLGFLQPRTAK
jgi:hypothetical protein